MIKRTYTVCEQDGTVITITSEIDLALREHPKRGRYVTAEDPRGVAEIYRADGTDWMPA